MITQRSTQFDALNDDIHSAPLDEGQQAVARTDQVSVEDQREGVGDEVGACGQVHDGRVPRRVLVPSPGRQRGLTPTFSAKK